MYIYIYIYIYIYNCNCCVGAIVASALTLGESEFLKALDIETPNPPS